MPELNDRLPFGTTIGILGGGQLGRMLALAAAKLGMKTHIFCPDANSPAFEVTPHSTCADYEDFDALASFAKSVDVVTYEFENVPVKTAEFLADLKPVYPDATALAVSQDRLAEKAFLSKSGIAIADFRPVNTLEDLNAALSAIGTPAVLKTTRMGYDGKGQRMIRAMADANAAFDALSGQPLVLEAFVPFEKEISVIVARSVDGEVRAFDPAENVHRDHILKTSTVPATVTPETAAKAIEMAREIATALNYVGVLGVEFFVSNSGDDEHLLVNEIAPRVHNSGHWTEAVCLTNQFEQHIRAILNWPLGDPRRMADVQMENLIGDEIHSIPDSLSGTAQPHVYGKLEARKGRKMGHINHLRPKS